MSTTVKAHRRVDGATSDTGRSVETGETGETRTSARPAHLLVVSARTSRALDSATAALAAHLRVNAGLDVDDVAYTLAVGRQRFERRRSVVCTDLPDAVRRLARAAAGERAPESAQSTRPRLAFVVPGQRCDMAAAATLYDCEPVFRAAIDRLAESMRAPLEFDLAGWLRRGSGAGRAPDVLARPPGRAEAVAFAVDHALATLWMSWGLSPEAVLGFGAGEYVCACVAGVLAVEDATALAIARARVAQGAMEHGEFARLAQRLDLHPPRLAYVSGVTGTRMTPPEAAEPSYWVKQLQWTSDMAAGREALCAEDVDLALCVGVGERLADFPAPGDPECAAPRWICSPAPVADSGHDAYGAILAALGELYVAGVQVDWQAFHAGRNARRTPLPTYPFERRRIWFEPAVLDKEPQSPPSAPAFVPRLPEGAREPSTGTSGAADGRRPAASAIETSLVEICESLLGLEEIGTHDNIVDLGADSMFTMQLAREVEDVFGVRISPHHLFAEPCIASLAQSLERAGAATGGGRPPPREARRAGEPAPDSDALARYEQALSVVERLTEEEIEVLLRGGAE